MKKGVKKLEHAIGLLLEVNPHKYRQGLFTSHNIQQLIEYFKYHKISLNHLSSNTLIPLSTLQNLYNNPKAVHLSLIKGSYRQIDFLCINARSLLSSYFLIIIMVYLYLNKRGN